MFLSIRWRKDCYFDVDVLFWRRRKYSEKENIFFLEEKKNRVGKGGKYLERISPKIVKDIVKSRFRSWPRDFCQFLEGFDIGLGRLGLGKKYRFWFRRIWSQIKSLGFENLVSDKKSRFRFQKIWSPSTSYELPVHCLRYLHRLHCLYYSNYSTLLKQKHNVCLDILVGKVRTLFKSVEDPEKLTSRFTAMF